MSWPRSARLPLLLLCLAASLLLLLAPGGVSGTGQVVINVDGGWSPWSTIATPCMRNGIEVTCGGGSQVKIRSCTNPRPQVTCWSINI